jgi:starch synthase
MKILIASSEAVPYIKTGGLADVAGALCKEYQKMKRDVHIILPLYKKIKESRVLLKDIRVKIKVPLGNKIIEGKIFSDQSSKYFFIACDEFFDRKELYGTSEGDYSDNASRFIFFSRGILEACKALRFKPDIIHCNDWQTGLVPLYLKTIYDSDRFFSNTATVLTIHNLGYQGLFPASVMPVIGLGLEFFRPERIEFYGNVNFLKAGIIYSDILNTVSYTYSKEILSKESGFGLDGVLRSRVRDLYGVINGIDYEEWDPLKDKFIYANYSYNDISGKAECKKELLKLLFKTSKNLKSEKIPLISMIGRLTSQKGPDLVIQSVDEIISSGVKLIILGKGDEIFQRKFLEMGRRYKNDVSVIIGFEESLAHKIYAGSDFFIMPSRYEPCGLGQLIASRYGCIPIARKTGGPADTIHDFEPMTSKGTGFLFTDYTPAALLDAVKRALCVYTDGEKMNKMIINGMKMDFSWKKSAKKYIELYCIAKRKASEGIARWK